MAGTSTTEDLDLIIEDIGRGGGIKPPASDGGGGDDSSDDRGSPRRSYPPSPRRYYAGITLGIVSILMFFMTLTGAFLLRRGSGGWVPVHLPGVLWINTAVLLTSSFTLELARRRLSQANLPAFRSMWSVSTALGLLFLAGQLLAWRQLVAAGVFLAGNPASSFFYIFTGAHAIHLFGGIVALLVVLFRKSKNARVSLSAAAEITSHYWHFMDALWVFLLALLYLGK